MRGSEGECKQEGCMIRIKQGTRRIQSKRKDECQEVQTDVKRILSQDRRVK